jgi:hypothetical protein
MTIHDVIFSVASVDLKIPDRLEIFMTYKDTFRPIA